MFVKNEVGSQIYVWTLGVGPTSARKEAVISAHGAQAVINSKCPPSLRGWCELAFYAPHGYNLQDPGLASVLEGRITPCERVPIATYQDYSLGKYQGKHNQAGETYDSIDTLGLTNDERVKKFNLAPHLAGDESPMDIITLRNRRLRSDLTLFDVLGQLKKAKYKYDVIHCSFCRGAGAFWQPDKGSYDASTHTAIPKTK